MACSTCHFGCSECDLAELIDANTDELYEARDATVVLPAEPMSVVASYWAAEWERAGAST